MPLDYDITRPYESIPIAERPLLLDEAHRLTEEGKRYLKHQFKKLAETDPKEAERRYHQMEPAAQAYVRKKGILTLV